MDWQDNGALYPDIGDLTPRELAERNTYGYVPSRGERPPAAGLGGGPHPPMAPPQPQNYTMQLNEILNALAALSRQLRTVIAELRGRGKSTGTPVADEAAAAPYRPAPAPPAELAGKDLIPAVEAAMRLGCSVGHVRKLTSLERHLKGNKLYFTRASVQAEASRRAAAGGNPKPRRGKYDRV